MSFRALFFRFFGFLFKPIFWILSFIFKLLKSPYKLGALIVGISILFGVYSSIQQGNFTPLINYIGKTTLSASNTISENLRILETQKLSTWDLIKTWLNILASIYMFFLLIYVFAWIITQISGNSIPNVTVYFLSLVIVLLLSNSYTLLISGHLPNYLGLGGFIDLFKYILNHKDFILNLIKYNNSYNFSNFTNTSMINFTNITR